MILTTDTTEENLLMKKYFLKAYGLSHTYSKFQGVSFIFGADIPPLKAKKWRYTVY